MTLYAFHKLLIFSAIAFCAGFAVREFAISAQTDEDIAQAVLLGLGFLAASVALAVYLRWLIHTKASRAPRPSPRQVAGPTLEA